MIDQGILDADNASYEELQNGDAQTAFTFIREKIGNTELTPAQIALDPCSGSAIVTDTTTGELLAMVSYPGYDLNKLSGTVDAEYWNKLINDQSEPLYDKATQDVYKRQDVICMVDNCYGEFIEEIEPSDVGADMTVGSLIKNPGGGLAPIGGYICGTAACIEQCAYRLSAPDVYKRQG